MGEIGKEGYKYLADVINEEELEMEKKIAREKKKIRLKLMLKSTLNGKNKVIAIYHLRSCQC